MHNIEAQSGLLYDVNHRGDAAELYGSLRMTSGGHPRSSRSAVFSSCRVGVRGIGGSRIFLEGVTLGTRANEASEH